METNWQERIKKNTDEGYPKTAEVEKLLSTYEDEIIEVTGGKLKPIIFRSEYQTLGNDPEDALKFSFQVVPKGTEFKVIELFYIEIFKKAKPNYRDSNILLFDCCAKPGEWAFWFKDNELDELKNKLEMLKDSDGWVNALSELYRSASSAT